MDILLKRKLKKGGRPAGKQNHSSDKLIRLFVDQESTYTIPEHRLLAAIILCGLVDMERKEVRGYGARERRREILSACYWFTRHGNHIGSFSWVCESLNISSDRMQRIREIAWRRYRQIKKATEYFQ